MRNTAYCSRFPFRSSGNVDTPMVTVIRYLLSSSFGWIFTRLLRHQPLAGHLVARFQLPSGRGGNVRLVVTHPLRRLCSPQNRRCDYAVHKKRALFLSNTSIHPLAPSVHGSIVLLMNFRFASCQQTARLDFIRHPPIAIVARLRRDRCRKDRLD